MHRTWVAPRADAKGVCRARRNEHSAATCAKERGAHEFAPAQCGCGRAISRCREREEVAVCWFLRLHQFASSRTQMSALDVWVPFFTLPSGVSKKIRRGHGCSEEGTVLTVGLEFEQYSAKQLYRDQLIKNSSKSFLNDANFFRRCFSCLFEASHTRF